MSWPYLEELFAKLSILHNSYFRLWQVSRTIFAKFLHEAWENTKIVWMLEYPLIVRQNTVQNSRLHRKQKYHTSKISISSVPRKEMTKRKSLVSEVYNSKFIRQKNFTQCFQVCVAILCLVLAWTRYSSKLALVSPY